MKRTNSNKIILIVAGATLFISGFLFGGINSSKNFTIEIKENRPFRVHGSLYSRVAHLKCEVKP